jgi:hypothetical protein
MSSSRLPSYIHPVLTKLEFCGRILIKRSNIKLQKSRPAELKENDKYICVQPNTTIFYYLSY